jgi:hypothetical protein
VWASPGARQRRSWRSFSAALVACNQGCRSPNPYTGVCGCPGGSTPIVMRALVDTPCATLIGSTIVMCAQLGAPVTAFGGAFQLDDAVPGGVGCRAANPRTGGCSCPGGTAPRGLRAEVDSVAGFIGSTIYVCTP